MAIVSNRELVQLFFISHVSSLFTFFTLCRPKYLFSSHSDVYLFAASISVIQEFGVLVDISIKDQ